MQKIRYYIFISNIPCECNCIFLFLRNMFGPSLMGCKTPSLGLRNSTLKSLRMLQSCETLEVKWSGDPSLVKVKFSVFHSRRHTSVYPILFLHQLIQFSFQTHKSITKHTLSLSFTSNNFILKHKNSLEHFERSLLFNIQTFGQPKVNINLFQSHFISKIKLLVVFRK